MPTKNPDLSKTPYSGIPSLVAAWAEVQHEQDQDPDQQPIQVQEQLPDYRIELQELGRGSLQNRAELLTQLLLSLEEELAYIDRPYTTRVDVCRGLIQDARRAGILKARAR